MIYHSSTMLNTSDPKDLSPIPGFSSVEKMFSLKAFGHLLFSYSAPFYGLGHGVLYGGHLIRRPAHVSLIVFHYRTDQEIQTYTIAVINALFLKAPDEKRQVSTWLWSETLQRWNLGGSSQRFGSHTALSLQTHGSQMDMLELCEEVGASSLDQGLPERLSERKQREENAVGGNHSLVEATQRVQGSFIIACKAKADPISLQKNRCTTGEVTKKQAIYSWAGRGRNGYTSGPD